MSEISSKGNVVALHPHGDAVDALRIENAQLQQALNSRIVIEQAKGAISARHDTTPDVAFELLRGLARAQRRDLHQFAREVVANRGVLDPGALQLLGKRTARWNGSVNGSR